MIGAGSRRARQSPGPAGPVGAPNRRRRTPVRPVRSWSLLGVTAAVSSVSLLVFLLLLAFPAGPPVLGWLLVPLSPLLGVIAAARVARRPDLHAAARRVWGCLAYAAFAILISTFSSMADVLARSGPPIQEPGRLTLGLFLAATLVALWGVIRLPVRKRTRREWLTVCLDVTIVLVASALIMWYAMTPDFDIRDGRQTSMMSFAVLGVLIAIKVSLTGSTGVDHRSLRVLAAVALVGTLAGSNTAYLSGRPDLNALMVVLPLVYAGVVYAAELQRTASAPRLPRIIGRRRRLPFSVLPYLAIGCTDTLLLFSNHSRSPATDVLIGGSVALTALVVARQLISFHDNRVYQDKLAYQASHDDLTGLANRTLFYECAELAVRAGPPGSVTVALVDLDDFKSINDRLGHAVGDALLQVLSERLRGCMRSQDTVARFGGDEFAVLLTGLQPDENSRIAQRILSMLAEPVDAGGYHLLVQASIGLAENTAGVAVADLLRRADVAMYAAKGRGKNRYAQFDDDLDASTEEHAQLAAELSQALDRQELHLLYQPIVELPTGRMVGVEALVRWKHPRIGLIPPVRFIPVAERTGLIAPVGAWVLRTACHQAADWQRRFGDRAPGRVTVNVSARQLLEPEFAHLVAAVLAETGLDPARLTMEITETAVFGGGPAVETVAAVHALGVNVALDDFGTGHSSLGLLRTCPVDIIKADKSFVDGVTGSHRQEAIATSISQVAQALGMIAIAEGVESAAQAERLYQLGYRLAQGFHFARPLPPAGIENIMRHGRALAPDPEGAPVPSAVADPVASPAG